MNVVDTWKLADHHKLLNAPGTKEEAKEQKKNLPECCVINLLLTAPHLFQLRHTPVCLQNSLGPTNTPSTQELSELTTADKKENLHVPIRTLKDNNGLLHHQVQYPVGVSKKGKLRSMTRECKLCKETGGKKHLVGVYSLTCGESAACCCPNSYNDRDCFSVHVSRIQ
jgi:hypothetical protein